MARLVDLARRREDLARTAVTTARHDQRASQQALAASRDALGSIASGAGLRLDRTLADLGRHHLDRAEGRQRATTAVVATSLDDWHVAHRRLGSLERLEERLRAEQVAADRRREQREADDLATTRRRGLS
jgi:flagellar biosynthesis chaperone FliJ